MISYRQQRKDRAHAELDAVVNYNHMIPQLVVLVCNIIGLGDTPGRMLLDALKQTILKI